MQKLPYEANVAHADCFGGCLVYEGETILVAMLHWMRALWRYLCFILGI